MVYNLYRRFSGRSPPRLDQKYRKILAAVIAGTVASKGMLSNRWVTALIDAAKMQHGAESGKSSRTNAAFRRLSDENQALERSPREF
jgi:hypothetical protein